MTRMNLISIRNAVSANLAHATRARDKAEIARWTTALVNIDTKLHPSAVAELQPQSVAQAA